MSVDAVDAILILLALPLLLASIYLGTLAIIALVPRPRSPATTIASPARRFAIIVPAHNEEGGVAAAVTSLRALDYPVELVRIVVVADNCDDRTAVVAHAAGAEVIQRTADRGKGYALATGLRLVAGSYDAVVFVDADCVVSSNTLRALDQVLEGGEQVVQARYTMRSRGDASHAALRRVALSLVHLVRPLAKERMRASAGLKGSGMCFSREAIEHVGWQSVGLAEDAEQHVRMLHAGMRVAFARDAIVTGEQPASLGDASSQHRRWEAGRADVAKRSAWPLLVSGLRTRSIPMLDAAVDLMIPPVSVVLLGLAGIGGAALVLSADTAGWIALGGIASLALYFAAGVLLSTAHPIEAVRAVMSVPFYAVWKARVYARALASSPEAWERTRRDS